MKRDQRQLNILKHAPILILMGTFALFVLLMGLKGDFLSSKSGVEQIVSDR